MNTNETMNTVHSLAHEAVFAMRSGDKQYGKASEKLLVAMCKGHEAGFKVVANWATKEHEQTITRDCMSEILVKLFGVAEYNEKGRMKPNEKEGYVTKDLTNLKSALNRIRWAVGHMIESKHYQENEGYKVTNGKLKVQGALYYSPEELKDDPDLITQWTDLEKEGRSMSKFNNMGRDRLGIAKAGRTGHSNETSTAKGAAKFLASIVAGKTAKGQVFDSETQAELVSLLSALMHHFDAVDKTGKIDKGQLEILEKKAANG